MALNTFAVEALLKQRDLLLARKAAMVSEINTEILDIERGIETLSGKQISDVGPRTKYDDENPNYIKGSLEEI